MTNLEASTASNSKQWLILVAVAIGTFMFSLDVHIVNLALPTLVEDLHSDFATVTWVPLSYSLMLSLLVLCVARLGDMWNKKWLYLMGLVAFTVSSLACGIAPTINWLIAARILQGTGAVFIAVLTPAIVTESFPNEQRGLALGIIASTGWTGVSFGPTVGGLLLEYLGWRWGFLINVPICLISVGLVMLFVPGSSSKQDEETYFDFFGAFLLTIALTCFLLGMTRLQEDDLGGSLTLILLIISAIGCVSFLLSQRHSTQPLVNLDLFRSLKLSLSLLLSISNYIFVNAVMFVLPFFLELVKHYSEQTVGLLISVIPILSVCSAPVAGALGDRFAERSVSTVGVVLLLIGCLGMSTFSEELTVLRYLFCIIPIGIGFGLFQPSNQSAIMSSVPPQYVSVASGLWFFSRALGQVMGITAISILISRLTASRLQEETFVSITSSPIEALVFGEQMSFRIVSSVLIISIMVSFFLWREQDREQ